MSSRTQIQRQVRRGTLGVAALLMLVGCSDSSLVLEAASRFASEVSGIASAATELEGDAALQDVGVDSEASAAAELSTESTRATAKSAGGARTYYQFIDDAGSVRFVSSLEEVPAQWRDRAGSVELSSPPPARPGDRDVELQARRERARTVLANSDRPRVRSSSAATEVELYYASWCGYCRKAKAHLDERGVDYVLLDVDIPEIKEQLFALTGSGSIPVLDIGGELVRGYDAAAIDRLISKR